MAPVGKTIRVASIREHGHALKDIRTPSRFSYAAKSIFVFVYVCVLSLSLSLCGSKNSKRARGGNFSFEEQRHNPTLKISLSLSFPLRLKRITRRHADARAHTHTHTERERERNGSERSKRNCCALARWFSSLGLSFFQKFFDDFRRVVEERRISILFV